VWHYVESLQECGPAKQPLFPSLSSLSSTPIAYLPCPSLPLCADVANPEEIELEEDDPDFAEAQQQQQQAPPVDAALAAVLGQQQQPPPQQRQVLVAANPEEIDLGDE
jgi:hypothetical protein